MTNSIGEIRDVDCLFVIGSNTTEAHPVIGMEMKRAARRGATLIVADPRKIWLSTIADRHLELTPGTDIWLLNAMAHVIIAEGLTDDAFIAANTENFEAVVATVAAYTPEQAAVVTGVSADDIRWAARTYATTEKAAIFYTLGITEHSHGTDNVCALANLVLMTGHLGKPSAGLNPLRGQNNVQGANDAGASPIYFPGYQRVDDFGALARYEASWGVTLDPKPGLNLNEMMKEMGRKLRGLFVMGEDIVLSEPNVGHLEKGLNGVDFLVIQDIFPNETTRFAHVVLPATSFAEKEGTFTNSERRVQRVRKAVEPPGQARADWSILLDLAGKAGANWTLESPAEVYAEMVKDTVRFAGISHERIDREGGLQWPCPTPDHPGTRTLHEGGVLRGKGLFTAIEYRPSSELPCDDYPFVLSTGRTLYHYNSATQTRREEGLDSKQPEAFVQIHPRDARELDVRSGDEVAVSTRRGEVRLKALVTRQVKPGRIWMPFHFKEARANLLTNDVGDSVTGTAEYKVCAAQVVKVGEGTSKFPGAYAVE
ncbi:MAG: formate dehydrogenase [Deltaproteobacteria bacterium CG2_30_63_29]|nr:MAG: formate dehydrogenase [Deltaproteobacteria bacterium CG2_30_63_29]